MNDDYDKELLDKNTSNNNKKKTEEEDAKSSLGNLRIRKMNRLISSKININSIRNDFELLFSLVSNNIDVLLISETKIHNTFPVSQLYVPGDSLIFKLDRTGNEGGTRLYVKEHIP